MDPLPNHLSAPNEFAIFKESTKLKMQDAKRESPLIIAKINELLLEVDPITILSQITLLDSLRRQAVSASAAYGSDASIEFLAGVITAMDPDLVMAREGTKYHPDRILELDNLLQILANCQNAIRFGEQILSMGGSGAHFARLLLSVESTFNRTEGYQVHVERIVKGIFEPIDRRVIDALGFPPSICIDLATAQMESIQDKFDKQNLMTVKSFSEISEADLLHFGSEETFQFATMIAQYAPKLEENLAGSLTERTGHDFKVVDLVLKFLTTELGSQEAVVQFSQPFRIQTRPILKVPDGRMLWLRPVDFAHEALDWFHELCQENENLKTLYDKSRQRETPKMAAEILSRIFGESNIHVSPTYESSGRPDADILVSVPGGAVLFEVKARHFTAKGRQGDIDRLTTKYEELILNPIFQLNRDAQSLLENIESWTDSRKRPLNLSVPNEILKVVINLENIDPLAAWSQWQNEIDGTEFNHFWLVSLSDLMMVAQILNTPSEMYSYIKSRSEIFAAGRPIVGMESDALALWCRERFPSTGSSLGSEDMIGYQSDELNDYFMLPDPNGEVARPDSSIPQIIKDALEYLFLQNDQNWLLLAPLITSVPPVDWKKFNKLIATEISGKEKSRRERRYSRKISSGFEIAGKLTVAVCQVGKLGLSDRETSNPRLYIEIDEFGRFLKSSWI